MDEKRAIAELRKIMFEEERETFEILNEESVSKAYFTAGLAKSLCGESYLGKGEQEIQMA